MNWNKSSNYSQRNEIFAFDQKIKGRNSSVGIATHYGLDGPGIESRWSRDFPHLSRPALGLTHPPVQWVPGLSRVVMRPGRGVDHAPPYSAEVKETVELYLLLLLQLMHTYTL
jgi:hypothetical protein